MKQDLVAEEWRAIPRYEGIYEASSYGQIRSLDRVLNKPEAKRGYPRCVRGLTLKQARIKDGYLAVGISDEHGLKTMSYVSHIIAATFIGPRPHGMQVCHNDGCRQNNRPENLRYDTRENNELDKIAHGTIARGVNSGSSKLTEDQVRSIRRLAVSERIIDIAPKYGISANGVSQIVHRRTWTHLSPEPDETGSPEGDALRKRILRARRAAWMAVVSRDPVNRRRVAERMRRAAENRRGRGMTVESVNA